MDGQAQVRSERGADESTPLLRELVASDAQETHLSPSSANTAGSSASRQIAPDLLRGLLVALMAIDHTSFTMGAYPHGTSIHSEAAAQVVTNFTDALPYTLRTLTHLCAPGFTMLIGLGLVYFSASRVRQGWTVGRQIRHILVRALFIILVNTFSIQFFASASGRLYLLNAVLWALAIDYVIVGLLGLFIVVSLEPLLKRSFAKLVDARPSRPATTDEEQEQVKQRAADMAWHTVNLGLLLLSALALWVNVWTSPHQGECQVATTTSEMASTVPSWGLMSAVARPLADGQDRCASPSKVLWDFIFQQVNCPGIMSGFPPAGWLSFVLFGYLYGRILINGGLLRNSAPLTTPRKASRTHAIIILNLVVSIVFALLFVSTRLLQYGNLSTACLHTPAQAALPSSKNAYLASFRSFLYIVKYPPSPAFAFATLSACFLLLALFGLLSNGSLSAAAASLMTSPRNPLLVYGNQPLFFYGIHFHFLNTSRFALQRLTPALFKPQDPAWARDGIGLGLGPAFFAVYAACLAFMYVTCKWYAGWKKTAGSDSVWRFL